MTIPVLKIKALTKATVKGKMDVRFPANVATANFLTVTKSNGTYTFGVDYSLLASTSISSPANAYIAVQDRSTGVYSGFSIVDFAAQVATNLAVVTSSSNGLAPQLPNDATKFLDGTGHYTVPAAASGVASLGGQTGALLGATGGAGHFVIQSALGGALSTKIPVAGDIGFGTATVSVRDYANLAAAYAALPSTGGVVLVPDGYTETLAADVTMNKSGCGFLFLGSAAITMGGFHFLMSTAGGAHGGFIRALTPNNDVHGSLSTGVRFIYTGSGDAIQVGTNGTRTAYPIFENFKVDNSGASSGAAAIGLTNTQLFRIDNVTVASALTRRGINLNGGTGGVNDFTGYGIITNPSISGAQIGIITSNQTNEVVVIGGGITGSASLNQWGIYRTNGAGFVLIGTELGSLDTAIVLDGPVVSDNYMFYGEANNADFTATVSTATDNLVTKIGTALGVVNDSGVRNVAKFGSQQKLPKCTVAQLPTANATNEGLQFVVTDANATTYLSTVAGGGSNHVPVTCLSSAWKIT